MTKPPAADLSDLLARVAARDREAFAAVYKATSAKLWGIVVRILVRAPRGAGLPLGVPPHHVTRSGE